MKKKAQINVAYRPFKRMSMIIKEKCTKNKAAQLSCRGECFFVNKGDMILCMICRSAAV